MRENVLFLAAWTAACLLIGMEIVSQSGHPTAEQERAAPFVWVDAHPAEATKCMLLKDFEHGQEVIRSARDTEACNALATALSNHEVDVESMRRQADGLPG